VTIYVDDNYCRYLWDCGDWSDCVNNIQTRICINEGSCPNIYKPPETRQECNETINRSMGGGNPELFRAEYKIDQYNWLESMFIINDVQPLGTLEIEFNVNIDQRTVIFDYVGPISLQGSQKIVIRKYNLNPLPSNNYIIEARLFNDGIEIARLTNPLFI
jgi:hypothetical protein